LAAPPTFATKAEATGYLAALRTDQGRGVWVDPAVGQVPFGEYAATWMRLRERTPQTASDAGEVPQPDRHPEAWAAIR